MYYNINQYTNNYLPFICSFRSLCSEKLEIVRNIILARKNIDQYNNHLLPTITLFGDSCCPCGNQIVELINSWAKLANCFDARILLNSL